MIRIILTCLVLLAVLLAVPQGAFAQQSCEGIRVVRAMDIATVTTGGSAVFAINGGGRTCGGWIMNPTTATVDLCVNEAGAVASGTTSAGSLVCLAPGRVLMLARSQLAVSVISADSSHPFAGEGWQ
jgi:hypothetical protein